MAENSSAPVPHNQQGYNQGGYQARGGDRHYFKQYNNNQSRGNLGFQGGGHPGHAGRGRAGNWQSGGYGPGYGGRGFPGRRDNDERWRGNRDQGGAPSHAAHQYSHNDAMVQMSKSLAWVLRHSAEKCGLTFMNGGFLHVDEVLKLPRFKGFTSDDVKTVVESNDKQRFALETDGETGRLKIRANQGHTVAVEGLALTPITMENADDFPTVIHGTYLKNWESIKAQGLSRMNRNHIHFAPGEPKADGVISGMRQSCEVLIFVDLKKALKGGIEFFQSSNKVILSAGDKDGHIFPCYFEAVNRRNPRSQLQFDNTISSIRKNVVSAKEAAKDTEREGKKKKKKNKKPKKEESMEDDSAQTPEKSEKAEAEERPGEVTMDTESTEPASDHQSSQGACAGDDGITDDAAERKQTTGQTDDENRGAETMDVLKQILDQTKAEENRECKKPKISDEKRTGGEQPADESQEAEPSREPAFQINNTLEKCKEAVDVIRQLGEDEKYLVVLCLPPNKEELSLICMADAYSNINIFDLDSCHDMAAEDGPLWSLLQDNDITKVFHGCAAPCKTLFEKYKICVTYMKLFDTQIAFKLLADNNTHLYAYGEATVTALAKQLKLPCEDPPSGSQMITWTHRPLTDEMKDEIKREVITHLDVYKKLQATEGWDGKDFRTEMYKRVGSEIDGDACKELHEGRKKKKEKAKKKDPNAQVSKDGGKKQKGKGTGRKK